MASPLLGLPGGRQSELDRGAVFFVGTATTVIRLGGFTILTDPNFLHAGDHAHLGYGMTSRRLTEPAIDVRGLPPLDLCVLSHLHGDHWDHVAADRLRKDLTIVTTPQAARGLRDQGFVRTRPLERWQYATFVKGAVHLKITAMPGRHGPPLVSRLLPSVMGSMLEWSGADGICRFRLYLSGDTRLHRRLVEIPRRFPRVDLALLHLGGMRLLGILVTMDARQGVRALRLLRPAAAIPIHHDDYPIFRSSLRDFLVAVDKAGMEPLVHTLRRGEAYEFTVPARAGEGASGRIAAITADATPAPPG